MKTQINLSDFNFDVPSVGKSRPESASDCMAVVAIRGHNRKNTYHHLLLSTFFHRTNLNHKTLSIGVHKYKKQGNNVVLVAFDKTNIQSYKISSHSDNMIYSISSKSLVYQIYNAYNIEIFDKPGISSKFFFDLDATDNPGVYVVVPKFIERTDAIGTTSKTDLSKFKIRES